MTSVRGLGRGRSVRRSGPALLALVGVLLGFGSVTARAHDFGGTSQSASPGPAPDDPLPCDDGLSCQCDVNRSDSPISYFNGGESVMVTDLTVNGVYPIALTRKYDSRSDYDSPLGYGWVFLHDRRLYEYPDGSIVVRHGCGMRDRYVFSGGAYVRPVGGMLSTLSENPDGSFELAHFTGARDYYDSQGRLTAERDRFGNRHEFSYDARGKLPLTGTSKAAVDPTAPMQVALNYRLTRIDERGVDGTLSGRYVTFAYDETTGRLTEVTANDGRTVGYAHDQTAGLTKGNLLQVTGLENITTTYAYADPYDAHNLTSITEAQGSTPIVNTYDDQDRVIRQDEGTRKIEFNYQIPLTKTVVTQTIKDQNGLNPYTAVTTYDFDPSGRITKITDALGHETRNIYNAAKLLERRERWQKTGATLALLQGTDFTYDAEGHTLTEAVTLDAGEVITKSWSYDHDWVASEQVVSSAAPGKIFRTEYTFYAGSGGAPLNIQSVKRRKDDGSFQTTAHTYDARGRLLTTTLPDGVKTVNEYTGDFLTKTYVEVGGSATPELTERFDYDAKGHLSKRWDARNHLTQFVHDDRGRLESVTNPLGEQTLYGYTGPDLTQVERGRTAADGEGQVTRLNYDSRHRLTSIERKNDGGAWVPWQSFSYDSEDRRLTVTDGENRTTTTAYDLLGRMTSARDALNKLTTFAHDAAGNLTLVTDALSRQVAFEYDDLNRRTAMVELGVTPSPRTEYAYDAAGNLTALKDPENHTTTYAYDSLSRNTAVTQPLGQAVQYSYDSRDRVDIVVTARGRKLDYAYEPWGALKEEQQYPTTAAPTPDRTLTYGYDDDGNLTSVTDDGVQAGAMYATTYDSLGRAFDETVKYLPGGDRVLEHRYDRFGNRKQLTLQDGTNLVHSYTYNKLNQLASASLVGAAVSASYFATNELQTLTLPNGVSRSYSYKPNGPLDTITVTGSTGPLAQYAYSYDDVLNVDTLTDPDGLHDYGYDGLNRLTTAIRPAGLGLPNESYAYDRVGNREDPGNAALYGYDSNNRINASAGLTYTFDADGSLASRSDGATFSHDPRNRLIEYSKSGTTASYLHDPLGRRIQKTVNGTTTWYLWDGSQLLAEYSGTGTRQQRYAYLDGYAPTQVEDANGVYYLHADHLDTPRLLTNAAGAIVWRVRYEAFGKATVENDPDGNGTPITLNVRFPGQYYDAESGLHYNGFRDYDPATGRYVQSDPIGLAGGLNTHAYVKGNPLSFSDALGLYIPKNTANCRVSLFPAFERRYGERWQWFDEHMFKLVIPIVIGYGRDWDVGGYAKKNFYWQQYNLYGLWEHNQNYLYICTETDECGNTKTDTMSGNDQFQYEKLEESGTRRWSDPWEYIQPPNHPPTKLPPPFPQ
jgi:RHS repeat-associated protein